MSQDTIQQIREALERLNLRDVDVRITIHNNNVDVQEYVNYLRRD